MWEEQRHRPFASHCHVLLPQPGHPRRDSGYRAPVLDKVYSALVLAGPVSSPAGPVTNMSHLLLHAQACRLQATVAKVHDGLSMGTTGRAWGSLAQRGLGPRTKSSKVASVFSTAVSEQGGRGLAVYATASWEGPCVGGEGGAHPMGIKQSLAFSLSSRREVIFPGFTLSAMDMDSTLRKRVRRVANG